MPAVGPFFAFLVDKIDQDDGVVDHHSRQRHHGDHGVEREGQSRHQETQNHPNEGKGNGHHHDEGLYIAAELRGQDGEDEQQSQQEQPTQRRIALALLFLNAPGGDGITREALIKI